MLSATLNGAQMSFVYDSANRLISAGGNTYTYNVEDVRVRNLCGESETTYAYNTNGRLSQLLVKTTDGVVTKYVYGLGLIGEEIAGTFKTYHFDYRGSTTAITDINGNVTDTFAYDTYGNLVSRTGTSVVIFLYNGRDGVVTDDNGLIYMRARYYSPELRRFINADIIAGEISNAVTLNRYAYANGNPVSNIDPFGLSAERGNITVYYGDYWGDDEHLDLLYGDLSKSELRKLDWINWSDFFLTTELDYIMSWYMLVDTLSMGSTQDVLVDMMAHFLGGTGTDYSNSVLTEKVKKHSSTIDYMQDFTNVFNDFVYKYQGDVSAFANGDSFKQALRDDGVLFTKYDYWGKDILGGLTMAIHSWTESQVDLTSFKINNNNTYSGNLRFTFKDNFGLDADDISEFGALAGFRSWFILQHYDKYDGKYKPFKTVVTIDYPIFGSLERYSI